MQEALFYSREDNNWVKRDLLEGVLPGPDGKIDILTLMSHPDDESVYAGGTLIKLKKDPRVRLHLACLTLGDKSDARFFMRVSEEELARIRTKEFEAAGKVLGADELIQLSYHDQGLKSLNREELVKELAGIIERTGAHVVFTHDPAGVTRHPDHVTCSQAATDAFYRSNATHLIYPTLPSRWYKVMYKLSPFNEQGEPAIPNVKVDISYELKQKRKALFAHNSQVFHSSVGLVAIPFYFYKTEWLTFVEPIHR